MLLRIFSLAVKNNFVLLRNNIFLDGFMHLSILFILLANLFCSSSAAFDDKYSLCISLKKQ